MAFALFPMESYRRQRASDFKIIIIAELKFKRLCYAGTTQDLADLHVSVSKGYTRGSKLETTKVKLGEQILERLKAKI